MARICIVTDSSAFFPNPAFSGQDLVTIVPMHIRTGARILLDSQDPKDVEQWQRNRDGRITSLHIPSVDELQLIFTQLGQEHGSILAILHSSQLSSLVENARQAAFKAKNPNNIYIIDSHTLGAGLGLLVQAAAQRMATGMEPGFLSQIVRGLIPHIYTVFFLPNLSYLAQAGFLDPAQAVVSEMLGFSSFFVLESSRLVSIQKARNSRQLVDMLVEFVTEFADLHHIALFHGYPPYEQEMRSLGERISKVFPDTPISEHYLSLSLLSLLGPRILGLVAMESFESR